jgi:hypothetical protein
MLFPARTLFYRILFVSLGLTGQAVTFAANDLPRPSNESTASSAAAVHPSVSADLPAGNAADVAAAPVSPGPRAIPSDEVMPSAMIFRDVQVGVVAQIIGARLGRKVEVEANAKQPISGNFGATGLLQALTEAAAQAGLAVMDEGPAGLRLVSCAGSSIKAGGVISVLPVEAAPIGKSTADLAVERQRTEVLIAADEKRIELLKLRAKLLSEEAGE